jgi:multimeric flavodoxin WrbA
VGGYLILSGGAIEQPERATPGTLQLKLTRNPYEEVRVQQFSLLGISSSPRGDGNTAALVQEALRAAQDVEGASTRYISLSRKKIAPCIDCDACPVEQIYCIQRDDMQEVYEALLWADGMVFGTPVYFQTLNAQMKALMDRCRPLARSGSLLSFKVGGALAVGGGRNHGQEFAIHAIQDYFSVNGMLTVGAVNGAIGVSGFAWQKGRVKQDEYVSEIHGNMSTMKNAALLGKLVATCTRSFKAGSAKYDPWALYPVKQVMRKNESKEMATGGMLDSSNGGTCGTED